MPYAKCRSMTQIWGSCKTWPILSSFPQVTMAQGGQARRAEGHHARGLTRSDNIISSAFLSRLARRRRHSIAQTNTAQHNIALAVLNRATHYRPEAYTINCQPQCRTGRTAPNWKHSLLTEAQPFKSSSQAAKAYYVQLLCHCRSTPEIQVLKQKLWSCILLRMINISDEIYRENQSPNVMFSPPPTRISCR